MLLHQALRCLQPHHCDSLCSKALSLGGRHQPQPGRSLSEGPCALPDGKQGSAWGQPDLQESSQAAFRIQLSRHERLPPVSQGMSQLILPPEAQRGYLNRPQTHSWPVPFPLVGLRARTWEPHCLGFNPISASDYLLCDLGPATEHPGPQFPCV